MTGANGDVGRALIGSLDPEFVLRLAVWGASRDELGEAPCPISEICSFDIQDLDAFTAAMEGMDAVVHLAGEREVGASWSSLSGPNVEGVYNLFEAARRSSVGKVVFASSNHVTGREDWETQYHLTGTEQARADSLYGVTKAFGEVLGRYASDYYHLSVICLRIGWVLARPHNEFALRVWLSAGDLGRLVSSALRSARPYGIYYGTSANTRCPWDLSRARRELGYKPVDDSEGFAAELGLANEAEPAIDRSIRKESAANALTRRYR